MGPRETHLRELADETGGELILSRDPFPRSRRPDGVGGFSGPSYAVLQAYTHGYRLRGDRSWAVVGGWDESRDAAYLVGLHELGHIARKHHAKFDWYRRNVLEGEAQAWRWALDHIRPDVAPTEAQIRETVRYALATYVLSANNGYDPSRTGPLFAALARTYGVPYPRRELAYA